MSQSTSFHCWAIHAIVTCLLWLPRQICPLCASTLKEFEGIPTLCGLLLHILYSVVCLEYVGLSVGLSVTICWPRPWAVQNRLNWSKYLWGWRLAWAHGIMWRIATYYIYSVVYVSVCLLDVSRTKSAKRDPGIIGGWDSGIYGTVHYIGVHAHPAISQGRDNLGSMWFHAVTLVSAYFSNSLNFDIWWMAGWWTVYYVTSAIWPHKIFCPRAPQT